MVISYSLSISAFSSCLGWYAHAYSICATLFCITISLKNIYEGGYNAARGLISRDIAKGINQKDDQKYQPIGAITLFSNLLENPKTTSIASHSIACNTNSIKATNMLHRSWTSHQYFVLQPIKSVSQIVALFMWNVILRGT